MQHLKIEEAMYATLQLNLQVALYSELYVKVQKANKLYTGSWFSSFGFSARLVGQRACTDLLPLSSCTNLDA